MNLEFNNTERINEQFLKLHKGHVYDIAIRAIERLLIEEALKQSCGNRIEAAKFLGIHRNTLRMKMKDMRIEIERFKI